MKLGYFDFNPDYSIRPDDLARVCEERGYDSLWLGEHINIPVSRRTPYPLGGDLPKYYSHMRDPFISLMAAGAVTKNLKLATGICLMIERDPITTAKEVCDARQPDERARHLWHRRRLECRRDGKPWHAFRPAVEGAARASPRDENHLDRGRAFVSWGVCQFRSTLVLSQTCPETPSAHHHGQRQSHKGCNGLSITATAGARPTWRSRIFGVVMAELQERCKKAGRDPHSISISIFAGGDPEESKLHLYRELGVERVVLGVGRADVDVKEKVLPFLDRYAKLIPKLA